MRHRGRYRESPRSNDAVMVSISYELLYLDAAKMLYSMGIPPARNARSESDPIVIAGGPAPTGNPLPLWEIADAVVIGEFEEIADSIVDALSKPTRHSRLRALSEIEGVLVPDYTASRVKRAYVRDLDSAWYPLRQELPQGVEPVWGRVFMLETSRGCFRKCRFCLEGCIFKPRRDRSFTKLRELLETGVSINKVGKVSFYSLSFFDSPSGERILEHAVSLGLEVSVPSLRAETLTDKRALLLAEGGQRTVSIAPETGSSVIARAIMKLSGRAGALRAAEILASAGVRQVKVYLMAGFPGETEEDLSDTIGMMLDVKKILEKRGARVRASVNPFIPKPSTPLQWFGFSRERAERALELARALSKAGVEADVYPLDYAELQTALGRADATSSRAIIETALAGGGYRSLLRALKARSRKPLVDWSPSEEPAWSMLIEDYYTSSERLRGELREYVDTLSSAGRDVKRLLPQDF